ncbi:hypothetical protein A8M56_01705 [Yersinia pestis]|nr:hypothetical protein A8M56_01705 [Yersinia pestis]
MCVATINHPNRFVSRWLPYCNSNYLEYNLVTNVGEQLKQPVLRGGGFTFKQFLWHMIAVQ